MVTRVAPTPVNGIAASQDAFDALLTSFDRHLAAENRAANTRRLYRHGLRAFGAYLSEQGMPRAVAHIITREHCEAFLAAALTTPV